ncbi:hypothetical protein ACFVZH_34130 [Streptomyces sp. NPDC059534]|uniref:hypothetical protein n=1 Tax=Streptomyces sp. NPDC059534 TaxID=3346859 RepID=UPI003677A87E
MRPAESGGGGGTDFRSMSHQQMLAWLDEASSFYVRDAADRLTEASGKMRAIAQQLRDRTGRVDWQGEAEKAFTDWAESVASSTNKLADYSTHASTWMGDASEAIATAQGAMPRYTSHAQAKENLDAARKYHNDPDSQSVARNAQASMADSEDAKVIAAKEEANRQAAAAEMEKLSSSYQWSSFQMTNFDPPTFPPPPGDFVPAGGPFVGGESSYVNPSSKGQKYSVDTETGTGTDTTRSQPETRNTPESNVIPPKGDPTGPTHVVRPEVRPDVPVDLGIDSVDTRPHTPTVPTTQTPGGPPPITKPDGGTPPFVTTGVPPFTGKGGPGPLGPTGPGTGGVRNQLPNSLRGMPGPLGGTREGISGGRQVPNTTGRPSTGIPRSTVVGNEPTGRNGSGMGRGPMGGGHGMGGPMGGAGSQNGISGGRRLAGESGGVVGGKAQRAGAAGGAGGAGRPFTAGGSGLVRGGATKPGDREEQNGERPDYLVEDEETWQQGRRVAPPVID